MSGIASVKSGKAAIVLSILACVWVCLATLFIVYQKRGIEDSVSS
jgi:hypothetical protein